MNCPMCGAALTDPTDKCVACVEPLAENTPEGSETSASPGLPVNAASNLPESTGATDRESELELFVIPLHKFALLSLCSFGVYEMYWCYQNWKRIKAFTRSDLSPFWRAFFAPLWCFTLFGRIREFGLSTGVPVKWNSQALAASFLLLNATWRLPDPWSLVSFATVLPFVPVLRTTRDINDHRSAHTSSQRNAKYKPGEIAMVAIGGPLFALAVLASLAL
jgi:hypothetical protein